jgi:hypothetical protein
MKADIKKLTFTLLWLTSFSVLTSCDFLKEIWDSQFNWEGIYDMQDGWQIEFRDNEAVFITEGLDKPGISVGSKIATDLSSNGRTGLNEKRGKIRDNGGFGNLVNGSVTRTEDGITFITDSGDVYSGTSGSSSVSQGGNTNNGSNGSQTNSNTQTLISEKVEGENGDKKIFKVNIPQGTKKLEIKTSELPNGFYRNTADLFVRFGSEPIINRSNGYSWTADCPSINPNREVEICSINDPKVGQYYILLYGYNTYFISHLTVTITK